MLRQHHNHVLVRKGDNENFDSLALIPPLQRAAAPLLNTQTLAKFKPMLRTGKPDEQGVLVPIKTYRRFTTR